MQKKWMRITAWTSAVLVGLLLSTATFVQVQQHLFRHRCERLLADMQAIRLHQTTWQDAQMFMHRWGAWGHYAGTCTWTNCTYVVKLSDFLYGVGSNLQEGNWLSYCLRNDTVAGMYRAMGGRFAQFSTGFIVQDGTIWRRSTWLEVEVPPRGFYFGSDEPQGISGYLPRAANHCESQLN